MNDSTKQVKRTIKLFTEQRINPNKPAPQEGFPMRNWNIEIHLVHEETGAIVPATCYEKATYKLHPTFGKKATQTKSPAPFRIEEEGWGEFDMQISLQTVGKGETHVLEHDLNFGSESYEASHVVVFKNPRPELLAILKQSGPVPGDVNGAAAGKGEVKKRARGNKNVSLHRIFLHFHT